MTVADLLRAWLASLEGRRRPSTLVTHRGYVTNRIVPRLGALRLGELRAYHLDAAYGAWLAEGLAPSTVRQLHAVIRAALAQAVRWDLLATNPATRASPPSGRPLRTSGVPDPAEVRAWLTAARAEDPVLALAPGGGSSAPCAGPRSTDPGGRCCSAPASAERRGGSWSGRRRPAGSAGSPSARRPCAWWRTTRPGSGAEPLGPAWPSPWTPFVPSDHKDAGSARLNQRSGAGTGQRPRALTLPGLPPLPERSRRLQAGLSTQLTRPSGAPR